MRPQRGQLGSEHCRLGVNSAVTCENSGLACQDLNLDLISRKDNNAVPTGIPAGHSGPDEAK
jgi:hypothetical protein